MEFANTVSCLRTEYQDLGIAVYLIINCLVLYKLVNETMKQRFTKKLNTNAIVKRSFVKPVSISSTSKLCNMEVMLW